MGACGCITPSPNCSCHRNIIGDPTWVGWRQQPADPQKDLKDLLALLGVVKLDFATPQPQVAPVSAPKPYNEGWADGYREAYEQGKNIGFESGKAQGFQEGSLHASRHLEETLALQRLQETAETLPDVEPVLCEGSLSIANSISGVELVICCDVCDYVEEIEDDLSVRGLNERLNELYNLGHLLCEEE